jgi:hypothetical protein
VVGALRLAALILLGALLVLLALVDLAGQVPGNADDAFILLVYARHFAESGSLYYNAAEGALDGFSSLLDVIVKGLTIRLSAGDPIAANFWVSTGALAMTVAAGVLLASRIAGQRAWLVGLGALSLTLAPGLAEGTSYMLETSLFSLLLIGALACCVSERASMGPLLALALGLVLVRPEGTPIALLLVTVAALDRGASSRAGGLWIAAGFALLVGLYYAWRIWLFGHWAPNSYYAKTSASRSNELQDGWSYIVAHGGTLAGAVLTAAVVFAPLVLLCKGWSKPYARRRYALFSGSASLTLLGLLFSGGDCYAGARFLMPSLMIGIVALLFASANLQGATRGLLTGILVLASGAGLRSALQDAGPKLASLGHGAVTRSHFACSDQISARLAAASAGARVAQIHFQRYKYFEDQAQVFDLTGINQRDVAHLPVEGPVTFGKDGLDLALAEQVEVLHLDYRWTHASPMVRHTTAALLASPQLRERFAVLVNDEQAALLEASYLTASLVGVCGSQCLNVFVRPEWTDSFRNAGFLVQGD